MNWYCARIGHLDFLALSRTVFTGIVVLSLWRHRPQRVPFKLAIVLAVIVGCRVASRLNAPTRDLSG